VVKLNGGDQCARAAIKKGGGGGAVTTSRRLSSKIRKARDVERAARELHRVSHRQFVLAMRQIRMPQLNGTRQAGARAAAIALDNSCKVLSFSRAVLEGDEDTGGKSITDLASGKYVNPIKQQEMPGANICWRAYTWGEDSLRWTALNKSDPPCDSRYASPSAS